MDKHFRTTGKENVGTMSGTEGAFWRKKKHTKRKKIIVIEL